MELRLLYQFWNCECIEISWTCCVCLPLHPCWCGVNCIKMKINSVLDCTRRTTSRSREVILLLCLVPMRHISSAGSSCGLPSTREVGTYWSSKGPWHWGCCMWCRGRKKKGRGDLCGVFLMGLWQDSARPFRDGQRKCRSQWGKCQERVGKMSLEGLVWQQGSRGAVKLLSLQILINWLD